MIVITNSNSHGPKILIDSYSLLSHKMTNQLVSKIGWSWKLRLRLFPCFRNIYDCFAKSLSAKYDRYSWDIVYEGNDSIIAFKLEDIPKVFYYHNNIWVEKPFLGYYRTPLQEDFYEFTYQTILRTFIENHLMQTEGHGDFVFSNLLYHQGRINLIDPKPFKSTPKEDLIYFIEHGLMHIKNNSSLFKKAKYEKRFIDLSRTWIENE